MTRLRATPAVVGLPVTTGGVTLALEALGRITSVMPFRGQAEAVAAALDGWPDPGLWRATGGGRLVWSGRGRALAMGCDIACNGAALTDQTDAWCGLRLSGDRAADVLARLSPVDLRVRAFPEGSVARTLLGHMNALILRDGDGFLVLVSRSMAGSAKQDLLRAMDQVSRGGDEMLRT